MVSFKTLVISLLIAASLSAALTRYYFPQIQTKTVEVEKEVVHDHIVTVTHTVTQPSGATDTTTTTTDNSVKAISESASQTVASHPLNSISAIVGNDFSRGLGFPVYGITANRQVLGPISVGGMALTNGIIGITVGISF